MSESATPQRESKQTIEEKILIRMRKCGRILLHEQSSEAKCSPEEKLSHLSPEEKKELSYLLKKCLNVWKNPD